MPLSVINTIQKYNEQQDVLDRKINDSSNRAMSSSLYVDRLDAQKQGADTVRRDEYDIKTSKIDANKQNIADITSSIEEKSTVLESIHDILLEFDKSVSTKQLADFDERAKMADTFLDRISIQLNKTYSGSGLHMFNNSDTAPINVDLKQINNVDKDGNVNNDYATNIYSYDVKQQVAEGVSVDSKMNITIADESIKNTIGAINYYKYHADEGRNDIKFIELRDKAVSGLNDHIHGTKGVIEQGLKDAENQNKTDKALMDTHQLENFTLKDIAGELNNIAVLRNIKTIGLAVMTNAISFFNKAIERLFS